MSPEPGTAPLPADLAARVDEALAAFADPVRAEGAKRYLRSDLTHYGVAVPDIRAEVRARRKAHPVLTHTDVVAVTRALWARPVHETRLAACLWLEAYADRLVTDDTGLLAGMIGEADTWALVDVLAGSVAGRLLLRLPETVPAYRAWAAQEEMWLRRSGVLAFLLPIRSAETYARWFPVFTEVADPLLPDTRFFVRKAVGWVLREATRHHPDGVVDWVAGRLDRISGLTLREALKRVAEERKAPLIRAHRGQAV
ncbi:DNA alkylation repair protein [Yinghuangia sp. ASG 101]|uniref:DNA alkylation repair protein n=1 Tax=Yinghuangia sp. ASG 101 TaxID=2896848 RepID=UPI001E345733|nr:DNA alkylation repair protein [Yinghuangia sp. ASG 101]UGQ13097.1 DNA alkylation repair protein [Yinghuangia sp. ASG 101]